MGRFDQTIQHLRDSAASAVESLADIEGGRRDFVNGEETTGWWVAKYRQIIASSAGLIRGYEKHND